MQLSDEERKQFIDKIVGDSREVEEIVDEIFYVPLVELVKDIVQEEGIERCEWCDFWDDCLEETDAGQLCSGCKDDYDDEREEE